MKDRQVTHEGRRLIVPDSGTPFAATIYREKDGIDYEGVIEEGTPYNVESVLPDTTAESLGLDPEDDPTPADALDKIATDIGDMNLDTTATDLTGAVNEIVSDQATKHADSGWIAATLNTNVTATGNYKTYRLIGNILYINMVLTINEAVSTNKTLFTLPTGYRPNRGHSFPCSISNATSTRTVQFTSDGAVKFYANGTSTGSGLMIYLDFCFPID